MAIKNKPRRNSMEFIKELQEIKIARIKRGVDTDTISDTRLTRGLIKTPEWPTIKNRLITMPRDQTLERLKRIKRK